MLRNIITYVSEIKELLNTYGQDNVIRIILNGTIESSFAELRRKIEVTEKYRGKNMPKYLRTVYGIPEEPKLVGTVLDIDPYPPYRELTEDEKRLWEWILVEKYPSGTGYMRVIARKQQHLYP